MTKNLIRELYYFKQLPCSRQSITVVTTLWIIIELLTLVLSC